MQNFDITVQYPNWVWTFSVLISSLFRIRCYIFRRRGEIMMEWNCPPPPPSGSMIYSHYSLLLCCINIHTCLYIYTVVTNSEARKGVVGNPLNGSYYSSGYHGSCLNKLDFISADRGGGRRRKESNFSWNSRATWSPPSPHFCSESLSLRDDERAQQLDHV